MTPITKPMNLLKQTIRPKNLKKLHLKNTQAWAFLGNFLSFWLFFSLIGYLSSVSANTNTAQNQLANNPSPYLAMHGSDPIHWQTWQADTLATAQKEHKLIFISSGYFSCHWCHVMQAENFVKPKVAQLLNKYFISIKVDRELSPDLDQYLVNFAQATTGRAGWPQQVLLTPKGYPFFAFTFVKEPTLLNILSKSVKFWQEDPKKISQLAQKQTEQMSPLQPEPTIYHAAKTWQKFQTEIIHSADTFSGGLNTTTKFPNAPILLPLILHHNQNLPAVNQWLTTTLEAMSSPHNHLFDHVNGGFYRYTVDPEWQIPHFEKMLYTQALLAKIYLIASQQLHNAHDRDIGLQTLAYAKQHLFNPTTQLFMSSQSANDQHRVEGGNYLFSKAQLKAKLTAQQYQQVVQDWHLSTPSPNANGWHPTPTKQDWPAIKKALQTKPSEIPTDTKSLLGWNGLMLSAYATAMQITPNSQFKKMGQTLAKQLQKYLLMPHPPRALSKTGHPMGQANIQDFAYSLQGLKDWLAFSAHPKELKHTIQRLNRLAKKQFLTPLGWLYGNGKLLPGQVGQWAMQDDAIPSPTADLTCLKPQQPSRAAHLVQLSPIHFASYFNCQTSLK